MMNAEQRAAIEAAVVSAEDKTRGEIYCVAADASSDYREVILAWAAGVALLAPALLLMGGIKVAAPAILSGWSAVQAEQTAGGAVRAALMETVVLQCLLFGLTAILVSLAPVRRLLTPNSLKRLRVRERAREQFLARGLSATREGTGVLIYVSLDEHLAEIIADQGIASKVSPAVWERAMAALVGGMKRGDAAGGFAAAVALCGEVLAEHFPPGADNPDELPNALVELPRA